MQLRNVKINKIPKYEKGFKKLSPNSPIIYSEISSLWQIYTP